MLEIMLLIGLYELFAFEREFGNHVKLFGSFCCIGM